MKNALAQLVSLVLNLFEPFFRFLQNRLLSAKNMGYVFLIPNLVLFGVFVFLPRLLNVYYSLTGGTNILPQDRTFIGLENFANLLDCENFLKPNSCIAGADFFWRGMLNAFFFVSVQVSLMVLISLLTALVLSRKIIGRGFWRSVFFYPVMLSPVVVALIWQWILERRGILNALLENVGLEPIAWLTEISGDWAMFWVIFVSVWAHMGFYMLILLAGLQAIPADLYEAAKMDGTKKIRTFFRITLPLLLPTLLVVIVLALIKSFQIFDEVWVLTNGGPGSKTIFVMQIIYAFGFSGQPQRFGLASAASLILAAFVLLLILVQLAVSRRKIEG